jgi:hypothetical protein
MPYFIPRLLMMLQAVRRHGADCVSGGFPADTGVFSLGGADCGNCKIIWTVNERFAVPVRITDVNE